MKFIYVTAIQYWNTIYNTLTSRPSDKLLPANDHEEVEGIGQTLFSAGRYRLQYSSQAYAFRALSYTASLRAWREDFVT